MSPLFTEQQRFTQKWLWALLIVLAIIHFSIPIYQWVSEKPIDPLFTNHTMMIIYMCAILLPMALIGYMRLDTTITKERVQITFRPFVNRQFLWKDIEKAAVINYGFIGGWGIRLWTGYKVAYNVKGNKGLVLYMKNGKKYLIGTQKEEELKEVIHKLQKA